MHLIFAAGRLRRKKVSVGLLPPAERAGLLILGVYRMIGRPVRDDCL
jgi:hypothetical protein